MRFLFVVILFFLLLAQPGFGMSSASYQIDWDTLNAGGDDFASSLNYQLNDSIGGFAQGTSTGVLYGLQAGYRAAESTDEGLGLTLRAQESSTQVGYTAFSRLSKTVTVTSSGYLSVGDYIGVIENVGFSQRVAIGRVTTIASQLVTVDAWSGDQVSMSASPSGGDDVVYRLGGTALAFGTVSAGVQNTALAMASVTSTAIYGYTVYVQGDGLLRSGGSSIAPVTDGAVSVGSEEYGMSVTGTRAFLSGIDLAVTSTQRIIEQHSSTSSAVGDRVGMTFKLSTTDSTTPGTYGQTIYYTLTANY